MKQRRESFLKLNSSNRGAALLSIIIVMAVVSVLAMLALSVSYSSFRMRNVDKRSSDNFYGAERVLEEICIGLKMEVSEQYIDAYTDVMSGYSSYESAEDMQSDYEHSFISNMMNVLKDDTKPGYYNLEILRGYVNAANYDGVTYSVVSEPEKRIIDEVKQGVCIRNLTVVYEEDGYHNEITTDIRITMPVLSFAKVSNMPSITEYALIADDGLQLPGTAYTVQGRIYAGKLDEDEENSITLASGALLQTANEELTKTPMLVSEGAISLVGGSKLFIDEHTQLWASDVSANKSAENAADGTVPDASNELKFLGKTYIKDDVTLNGKRNSLTLGGEYFGYSSSDKLADESSAIIINGAYTTLDMSALDTMVLAGTSFVGTKGESHDTISGLNQNSNLNSNDILMGDSIAVKSNQLLYMVSTEAEGIDSNPMSYKQYQKLTEDPAWESKALSSHLAGIGRSADSYGKVKITPVFTNRTGGAVYLYLEFEDAETAGKYFMDCYGKTATGSKVQSYLSKYVETFKFTTEEENTIVTKGNYLVPIDGTTSESGKSSPTYQSGKNEIEAFHLDQAFKELCEQSAFESLIDEMKLSEFVNNAVDIESAANGTTLTTGFTDKGEKMVTLSAGTGTEQVKAIVVDNRSYSYVVREAFQGVLIATGDVEIAAAGSGVKGLILCNGSLKVTSGTALNPLTLTNRPEYVAAALRIACSTGEEENIVYSALSVFKGYEGTVGGNGSEEISDVRDCITYENWKSE